ncbi:WD40 repeat protein [Spironucleus salmonicida]|uniref:WD domain, G-beta repeat-containing protein n=1 Tax=Spironucleus salmonicida TaxID=348837 RepID=V6LIJ3_9EUKA|nr:WD40 repeat protein [Spironucleus salmonicida]|eukprot:EST44362.1 WD domain, G-beta repeat-containing protein [Spironucleus salmonicida]
MNLRPIISDDTTDTHAITFSPDTSTIASGCGDGSVRVYAAAAGRRLFRLQNGTSPITSVQFKPELSPTEPLQILSASSAGVVTRWHASRGTILSTFTLPTEIYNLKYAPDASIYAAAGKDKAIRIFDENTNSQLCELRGGSNVLQTAGHSNRIFSVEFDKLNHNILYSSGWDNTVQIWDIRCGHSVSSIHDVQVCGDSLDSAENLLLCGSWRQRAALQVFDLRNLQSALKDILEVKYDYSKAFDAQNSQQIAPVEIIKTVHFNSEKGVKKQIPEIDFSQLIQRQLAEVENLEDGEIPQTSRIPSIEHFEELQAPAENLHPTLVYAARFNQKAKNLVFGAGSGGNAVKIIDWEQDRIISEVVAPGACFCGASSACGRFGAFAGAGFGVQIFGFE